MIYLCHGFKRTEDIHKWVRKDALHRRSVMLPEPASEEFYQRRVKQIGQLYRQGIDVTVFGAFEAVNKLRTALDEKGVEYKIDWT